MITGINIGSKTTTVDTTTRYTLIFDGKFFRIKVSCGGNNVGMYKSRPLLHKIFGEASDLHDPNFEDKLTWQTGYRWLADYRIKRLRDIEAKRIAHKHRIWESVREES